jgi:hypothetical protein
MFTHFFCGDTAVTAHWSLQLILYTFFFGGHFLADWSIMGSMGSPVASKDMVLLWFCFRVVLGGSSSSFFTSNCELLDNALPCPICHWSCGISHNGVHYCRHIWACISSYLTFMLLALQVLLSLVVMPLISLTLLTKITDGFILTTRITYTSKVGAATTIKQGSRVSVMGCSSKEGAIVWKNMNDLNYIGTIQPRDIHA